MNIVCVRYTLKISERVQGKRFKVRVDNTHCVHWKNLFLAQLYILLRGTVQDFVEEDCTKNFRSTMFSGTLQHFLFSGTVKYFAQEDYDTFFRSTMLCSVGLYMYTTLSKGTV